MLWSETSLTWFVSLGSSVSFAGKARVHIQLINICKTFTTSSIAMVDNVVKIICIVV